MESGGARLAGQRLRPARLRPEKSARNDPDVACVRAAVDHPLRRAGSRVRVPRTRDSQDQRGAVRRCDRFDHRRVARVPAADGDDRNLQPRMARGLEPPHSRARTAHSGPGSRSAQQRSDDAAGSGAGQRREADALADARREEDARPTAARDGERLRQRNAPHTGPHGHNSGFVQSCSAKSDSVESGPVRYRRLQSD